MVIESLIAAAPHGTEAHTPQYAHVTRQFLDKYRTLMCGCRDIAPRPAHMVALTLLLEDEL